MNGRAAPPLFAIPATTTSRLLTVWLSVLAAAVFAGHWTLVLRLGIAGAAESRCAAGPTTGSTAGSTTGSADGSAAVEYLACVDAARPVEAVMILAGPAALVLVAAAVYAIRPTLIRRWYRLGPEPADRPITARVAERCAAVGLRRPPLVEIAGRRVGPFVYGRPPYRLAVPAAMLPGAAAMSPHDKALLAHEIAHVRAGDGVRYDLAMSAWYAALLIVVVPLAVDASTVPGLGGALLWRLLVVSALLILAVRSVVRAREHEADVRAAVEDPAASPGRWTDDVPARARAAGWDWLSFHPDRARRATVLRDRAHLLRPSVADAAVAGVGAGLLGTEATLLVGLLLPARPWEAYLLAALGVAVPAVAVLCLGAWRAAVAGRWLARVPAHGPVFGAGLLLGSQLTPRAAADWWRLFPSAGGRASQLGLTTARPGPALLVMIAALVIGTLVALWCAAAARLSAPTGPPFARRLLPGLALGTLALGTVLLGVQLAAWLLALRLAAGGRWPAALVAYTLTLPSRRTALLVAFGAAAAYLAVLAVAGAARRRPARDAGGVFAGAAMLACLVAAVAVLVTPALSRDAAARHLTSGTPRWSGVPFPRSHNSFYACVWVNLVGATGWPAPDDAGGQTAVGGFLSGIDDPVLAGAGRRMTHAGAGRDPAIAAEAARAVFVRCDAVVGDAARPLPAHT